MSKIVSILTAFYSYLLYLYPQAYREEFKEEMLLDFSDMVRDAKASGSYSLIHFCIRESIDFPINLLQAHWKEKNMYNLLHFPPLNYGWRNAVVFGFGFGLAGIVSQSMFQVLELPEISAFILTRNYYNNFFHTEKGLDFVFWLPTAFGSILTGLVIGTVFALLFSDHSKWIRYTFVGMLCWFLHQEAINILFFAKDFSSDVSLLYYLGGTPDSIGFGYLVSLLSGSFLGLTFYVARSENPISFRLLCIGAVACPVFSYTLLKILLNFWPFKPSWIFLALIIMLTVYLGGVILLALQSDRTRKVPWLVILGALIYLLSPYIAQWVVNSVSLLIGSATFADYLPPGDPEGWPAVFRLAIDDAIYGILFGWMMGLVFGLINRRKPSQRTAIA